jgi:RNA polymerase sigma-70 factor, ECF subfamily
MDANLSLLASARKMDANALTEIFDFYAPGIYKYVFRLSNNAVMADQIVGDVFSKLLELFSAGTGPRTNLRSYLFEMAYHIFVDEARYSYRRMPIETLDSTYTGGFSTDVCAEDRMMYKIVLQAILNDLTEDQRHVVVLRFLEGFSLKETALIIGKKVGNVKVIQNRAIAALRTALDNPLVDTSSISFMIRSMANV